MNVPGPVAWRRSHLFALALGVVSVFFGVFLLAGRDSRAAVATQAYGAQADATGLVPSEPVMAMHSPPEMPAPTVSAAVALARETDMAPVADLARESMPVAETTAEQNEQRGDALRQLGRVGGTDAVAALVYALRNDVDVRNRILAIEGLRRAALSGSSDRMITDALSDAARSDDEVIAAQARAAFQDVSRR